MFRSAREGAVFLFVPGLAVRGFDMSGVDGDREVMRHSASHVLAEAVRELFPDARFGIGPAIEDGFYYDFELPR
jgi:hypothetical protein